MTTITLSGDGYTSVAKTVPDADWQLALGALRQAFEKPDASDDEIFQAWAESVFAGLRVLVRSTPPPRPLLEIKMS
jgi:hypothetical protein